MLVLTAKLSRKRIIAFVILCAIALSAVILCAPNRDNSSQTEAKKFSVANDADASAYFKSLGYDCADKAKDVKEVQIPKEFDDVYKKYNEMQKTCGFDLEKYSGKNVTLYNFNITNYKDSENVVGELLVYKKKIIGGSIYTAELDGFMHGLLAQE